jgi:hypothetical protein
MYDKVVSKNEDEDVRNLFIGAADDKDGFLNELVLRYCNKPIDGKWFVVVEPFAYEALNGKVFIVPSGTRTDFASIPLGLRNIIPRTGKYGKAAVLHDWLCEYKVVPRKQADSIFFEAMKRLGVNKPRRSVMYFGVAAYTFVTGKK